MKRSDLQAIREASQDERTAHFIELVRIAILPSVLQAGWVCLHEGEDGLGQFRHEARGWVAIHSIAIEQDKEVWLHVSMSRRNKEMPPWRQVRDTWWEFAGNVRGLVVLAPPSDHVNLAEVAHAWGCLTNPDLLPDFSHGLGTI